MLYGKGDSVIVHDELKPGGPTTRWCGVDVDMIFVMDFCTRPTIIIGLELGGAVESWQEHEAQKYLVGYNFSIKI